jgi:uncharacterized protein
MRRDELNQPLHKRSLRQRLWKKRPSALASAYAVAVCAMIGGGTWLTRQPHPFAGEPIVVMAVPPVEEVKTASIEPLPEASASDAPADAETEVAAPVNSAHNVTVKVDPSLDQVDDAPKFEQQDAAIFISPRLPLTKAPIFAVTETSDVGMLPRIASNGKKPSEAYAKTVSMGIIHSEAPKIIIILGGMGLNDKLTRQAAKDLPAEISFAFAPYGTDLQAQVDKVRALGHEVLLQLPLEPVGFPVTNPGPKTLLTDGAPADNLASLYWHMSRFTGYTGIINYMGGRFLSSAPAIKPLLTEFRKRGLLFIEDGSLALSATDDVAKSLQYPVRRGQSVIDVNADPNSITTALNLLEEEANRNGTAIGIGSGLEVTVKTVSDWAKAAQDRGVIFMPASAAFKGRLG